MKLKSEFVKRTDFTANTSGSALLTGPSGPATDNIVPLRTIKFLTSTYPRQTFHAVKSLSLAGNCADAIAHYHQTLGAELLYKLSW